MRHFISILLLICSFPILMANEDDIRAQIFEEMKAFLQEQKFDKAKKLYLDNALLLKDNGLYECLSAYLYGCLLSREEQYVEALKYLQRSINILDANYEDVINLHDINFVIPYYHYAYISGFVSEYDTESLFRKAKKAFEDAGVIDNSQYLQICEELTNRESADDVSKLNSIISHLSEEVKQGETTSVANKIERCLAILDKMPTRQPKMYGILYQLKGRMAWVTGDMNEAEAAYMRALKEIETLIPIDKECQEMALKLYTDLAAVYGAVKDYNNCAVLLQICRTHYEQEGNLGYEYARTLGNLSIASIGMGNKLQATMLLETAIDILAGLENINPIEIATIYSSASVCYGEMGNKEEALDAALKAREYLQGDAFPGTIAQVENNLGCLYMSQGNLTDAIESFERAVSFVGHNPLSPQVRFNLACAMFLSKDSRLGKTAISNSKILQDEVLESFLFLSERQRLNYWDETGGFLNGYNRFLYSASENKSPETIYDNALFAKGLLLRTSNWLTSSIMENANTDDRKKLDVMSSYQARIVSGDLSTDSIGYYEGLIQNLEKDLLRENISYKDLKTNLLTTWSDIKKSLGKGEVAIEFIQLPIIENINFTTDNEYAAILLRPEFKRPKIITLFNDADLDSILVMPDQLKKISDETKRNELYRGYLYGIGQMDYRIGTRRQRIKAVGYSLYSLIWSKLESSLDGCNRIYYSPISALNSVSFSALSDGDETLGEKYNLHLVSTTAEITKHNDAAATITDGMAYGGIEYDAESDVLIAQARSYNHPSENSSRGFAVNNNERGSWGYLAGTLEEASNVYTQMSSFGISCNLLSDVAANEESFKNLNGNSPKVLHIATHGFFLSNPKEIETNTFLNKANTHSSLSGQILNRAGLLFAGANRAWSGREAIPGIDDGILTANEISNLNLSSTDMVVLSACETGLGVDGASEGVFGLQRAFKLAGVNTILMSLWKVPDAQTSELMQTFYSNWLGGMDRHAAFSAAQRKIKESNPNPYYWAGFVMLD